MYQNETMALDQCFGEASGSGRFAKNSRNISSAGIVPITDGNVKAGEMPFSTLAESQPSGKQNKDHTGGAIHPLGHIFTPQNASQWLSGANQH